MTPATYTDAFKSRMIQRMTGPGAVTATVLGKEVGVSQPTLSAWLRQGVVLIVTPSAAASAASPLA